ncbi:MAG TPA: UDP-N-acetylmuramate--L-alanine ligase [Chitinophagales bacterium]|nr:UDP-N-acetylmuramate--L-alanine ligase [Chitinophagales bacterium]
MIALSSVKKVCFIGIGGIGMSAVARYFLHRGAQVFGYDRSASALTTQLEQEGATIYYQDNPALLPPDADLVIYTPAIPPAHRGLTYYREQNLPVIKRSEALQLITNQSFTIAIAGSHGKTTVTSMIAHILHQSGVGCTAFVGGVMTNYNSNFIAGNNHIVVVEADEFDRSFHRLQPDIAVITAVDSDHLEVYGTQAGVEEAFLTFANSVKPKGALVVKASVPIMQQLKNHNRLITYHLFYSIADVYTYNLQKTNTGFTFNIAAESARLGEFALNIEGQYNVENSIAAITVASLLQLTPEQIAKALATFSGIKRRFEFIARTPDFVMIDDYAHHPAEISALLQSVHALYPNKKMTVIFQPHLYSRTRDLAHDFAMSFRYASEVILLDIYPAREEPIEGVTSDLIFSKIPNKNKYLYSFNNLVAQLANHSFEVLVTVGAGNIDTLIPDIKAAALNTLNSNPNNRT